MKKKSLFWNKYAISYYASFIDMVIWLVVMFATDRRIFILIALIAFILHAIITAAWVDYVEKEG